MAPEFSAVQSADDLSKGVSNNAVVEFADQATNSELSSKRSTFHQLYSNLFSLWLWPPVARSVNRKEAQTPTHRPRPRRAASRVPRKEQLARLYRKIARRAPERCVTVVPAPAAKRKQAEAGADSEDDHVNKKARQTADSDDERPAPAPAARHRAVSPKSGGDSQDTHVDKDSRHDTGDIQDEEGDVQDEEGDVQDADEANAGTAHQSEGSGGTVSVKEQKLQQLAKNPLLLVAAATAPAAAGPRQRNLQISIPSIKWTGVLAPAAAGSRIWTITDNGWVATMDTREEEDLDLEEEYLQDVAKPKGKGKAAAVESSDGEEDPFPVASDDDEDEDEDEDETPNGHITPWAEARAARAAYHATLEDIARRAGKKMSTIFKAIGDYPKSVRDTNSWNAYQMKYLTPEESQAYEKAREEGYNSLFASLSTTNAAIRKLAASVSQPLMKWHREKTMQVVDNRKADGGGKVLMNKAVAPLIHQSTAVSNSLDIEVFGLALDCFGDNAIIWGGGALFQEVFKQHPLPIRKFLIDMKGLFSRPASAMLYVDNSQPCLVMIERGELELEKIKTTFQKIVMELRIENWPAALKEMYPGPGFSLGVITEKDNKKEEKRARMDAVKAMFNAMKAAYQSPDADDRLESTKIVSWTDEIREHARYYYTTIC
ncbi:hypothetical protein B0H14DRAFT_3639348 [Mycena olivaceomarginata]|nr:hypothetical protein B0H14DRAFT_3639348 [Mycena olivaceomarginata]